MSLREPQNKLYRPNQNIQQRLGGVQEIFTRILLAPPSIDTGHLVRSIESEPLDFQSIAFEAASFRLALKDFANDLDQWKAFLEKYGQKHTTNIHIGLGVAAAKLDIADALFIDKIAPDFRRFVDNGRGFYAGKFKNKFETTEELASSSFDEGLGRSMWYFHLGDLAEIDKLIQTFPLTRQPAIWKGVSIAFTYVGGFDKTDIRHLLFVARNFKKEIASGVAAVVKVRFNAGNVDVFAELAQSEITSL